VISFLVFGGLVAPIAEVKMGLGGTSYLEFIESVNLVGLLYKLKCS
jgi:hypothetical protein